jgi:hypothetical protein
VLLDASDRESSLLVGAFSCPAEQKIKMFVTGSLVRG